MHEPEEGDWEVHRIVGDTGGNLVEYSLLMALIVVVCLSALTMFGRNSTGKMSCASSAITNQIPNAVC